MNYGNVADKPGSIILCYIEASGNVFGIPAIEQS